LGNTNAGKKIKEDLLMKLKEIVKELKIIMKEQYILEAEFVKKSI
jgi:hypothetical protein